MHLTARDTSVERMPQIDGLRFIAILLVVLHHYLPGVRSPLFGHGVTLFFVLSGYFSTRQLLRARDRVATGEISRPTAILRFHARRYLRIFPVYFLVVGFAIAVGLPHARDAAAWHLSFSSNWYILNRCDWIGPFSPFWSLAVLEQFYLVWPSLLVCLPRRVVLPACAMLVATAVVWRGYCHVAELHGLFWLVHPLAGLDQLGMGALLAAAQQPGREDVRRWLRLAGQWVALPLVAVALFVLERPGARDVHFIYQPAAVALVFTCLVDRVSIGFSGWPGFVLGHATARAGGRLSYGIFALHEFTAYLIPPFLRPELPDVLETFWKPWVLLVATCACAGVAFVAIETPIQRLKRHFRA